MEGKGKGLVMIVVVAADLRLGCHASFLSVGS